MHLLRSKALGIEIIDDIDHHIQGRVADLLIDPDRGKVIALFLAAPGVSDLFMLQTQDIASWGNRIHIREQEVVGELSDFVRLEPFLNDPRTLIGQRIRTKSGASMGKCTDLQFRTDTFDIEWIFPKKYFFLKCPALPVSEILEVTDHAIIINDQGPKTEDVTVEEKNEGEMNADLSPTPAAGRYTDPQ